MNDDDAQRFIKIILLNCTISIVATLEHEGTLLGHPMPKVSDRRMRYVAESKTIHFQATF
jgi:hypothetical protein